MHPKPSSDIGNSISNIVEWEDKWTRMAKKFPSVLILRKMTVLMKVCPADVQDMVCQAIDDVHEDYERLEQKILSWVSNMMSIRHGLVLMGRTFSRVSHTRQIIKRTCVWFKICGLFLSRVQLKSHSFSSCFMEHCLSHSSLLHHFSLHFCPHHFRLSHQI